MSRQCQPEELKTMLQLTRPRYFVPITASIATSCATPFGQDVVLPEETA